MYDIKIRNLASVFVDAVAISLSGPALGRLLVDLDDDDLVSETIQEMGPAGPSTRVLLRNQRDETLIILGSHRFDFARLGHPSTPEGFRSFCTDSGSTLATLISHFDLKGHRLALVQEGFMAEMSPESMTEVADRLVQRSPSFSGVEPFEWDWRVSIHVDRNFSGLTETTNTIVTAKRCSGSMRRGGPLGQDEQRFDRIRVDLDVNTIPDDNTPRFNADSVRDYFSEAHAWHVDLEQEVGSFIQGIEGRA